MERKRIVRDPTTGRIDEVVTEGVASLKDSLTGAEVPEEEFDFFVMYGTEEDMTGLEPFNQVKPAVAAALELRAEGKTNVRVNAWRKGVAKINRRERPADAVAEWALHTADQEPEPHRIGFVSPKGP